MHWQEKLTIPSVTIVNKLRCVLCIIMFAYMCMGQAWAADKRDDFSPYLIKATQQIESSFSGRGYMRSASFSHNLPFGRSSMLKAKNPPYSMCVGAVLEVIITALDIYSRETGDYSAYSYLPMSSWERLRPLDLRGQIWIVQNSNSRGTAHALQNFGMGVVTDFRSIKPGALVNLNRTNRTGHAVIFLGYLDKDGNDLDKYGDDVAGFKYFSSQGNADKGGFGYRYAFFSDGKCPNLLADRKRDCGVIRSFDGIFLSAGKMLHPKSWVKAKALEQLSREAYHVRSGDTEMLLDGNYDAKFFTGQTTDD